MTGSNAPWKRPPGAPCGFYTVPGQTAPIHWFSLDPEKHLPIMFDWVNQPYAERFWQMQGSYPLLRSCYQNLLQNPHAHSYAAFYGSDMIAVMDTYRLSADELGGLVAHEAEDSGFHLIMTPYPRPVKWLSRAVVHSFLQFFFRHPEIQRIWAEPDVQNEKSIRLLESCGFSNRQTVSLSYKTAHVYCLERSVFRSQLHPFTY